jgi:hypothetical protein
MASYKFTQVRFDMNTQHQVTTGQAQRDAGSGARTEARMSRARAGRYSTGSRSVPAEIVGPDFSTLNSFVSAALDNDQQAMTALVVYPYNAAQLALGTGRVAGHRR